MSRHSVQIRALLQSKRLSKSRFNPQSSLKIIPQPTSQIKTLKRSQSSSSLRKKGNCQMLLIQQRYRKLQQNYRNILQQTKNKTIIFTKQKAELQKLKQQSEKDKKQIQRLRSMLGFIKKEDAGVQVDRNMQSRSSYEKDYSKISAYSKAQKSTDAGLRQTGQTWNSKQRKRSSRKQSRVKTPYKLLNNKSQTTICFRSPLKQSNIIKSPLAKYKFVPTLTFN